MVKMERTTAGLRELLFEQIEGVRDGTVDNHKASAVAKLAMTLLKSLEVEMSYLLMRDQMDTPEDANQIGKLSLAAPALPDKPTVPSAPQARTVPGRAY